MMAQTITCDLCQQEPAVMLETRIETGEVIGVGLACLIPFYVGAAGSLYDELSQDDAAAFAPAIQALAEKWALPLAEVSAPDTPAGVDGGPQLDGGHDNDGQAATEGPQLSPARRARNAARTPK